MTYLLLAVLFLAIAAAVAAVAHRIATRRAAPPGARPIGWRPVVLAAVALLVLTAVFDNLMIASGLFTYADAHISGLRIGLAPVEDFAYPLAGVVLLPALWTLFGSRRAR
ncbi:lycopene cyclase domain-containing protein [Promicromonospora sp. NPDC090134]|uniref:lycopene cyclase domain-containing protein n=1 Tax=Promicromonospora sp. NPDC090134 TaxID=3364408 RepID=UPI003822AA98